MPPLESSPEASQVSRAMDSLRRLVRVLRASNAETERRSGMSAAQLFVLRQITEHPGCSLGEVTARTCTTQSAASEVVSRLVERGLVLKASSADDRRRAVLTATARGEEVVRSAASPVQERLVAALAALPSEQARALSDGLSAWVAAAGFADLAPSMFFEAEEDPSHHVVGRPIGSTTLQNDVGSDAPARHRRNTSLPSLTSRP